MDAPRGPQALPLDAFRARLDAVLPVAGDALDVGTGTGRVALHVAPHARTVLGVDIDDGALEAARWQARRLGLANVRFVHADADRADLVALNGGTPFRLVTARLYFSAAVLQRAGAALAAGGVVVVAALESAQWQEAGGSRWSIDEGQLRQAAQDAGLAVADVSREATAQSFTGADEARAHLKDKRLWSKWNKDGRWDTWCARARREGWSLTEARIYATLRRPA